MENVLVFFGGISCEHDISVITGVMSLNALDKEKYNAIPVYVTKSGEWKTGERLKDLSIYSKLKCEKLKSVTLLSGDSNLYSLEKNKLRKLFKVYCAINCMHGGWGEDGGLYSLLRSCNIPCSSSSNFSSALSMDKEYTKIALAGIGIKFLPCVKITRDKYYLRKEIALKLIKSRLDFPMIIKPANLGSSIGIKIAKDEMELERGIDFAFRFDKKIIIEKMLENPREINCSVYKKGGEMVVSDLEEPIKTENILSFSDKYITPTEKEFPAKVDKEIEKTIKDITSIVYRKFGFSGVIRIDFLLSKDEIFVNEINTVPGSLAYYLFCKDMTEFSKMLTDLIEEGVDDYNGENQNLKTFEGGVLNLDSSKIRK